MNLTFLQKYNENVAGSIIDNCLLSRSLSSCAISSIVAIFDVCERVMIGVLNDVIVLPNVYHVTILLSTIGIVVLLQIPDLHCVISVVLLQVPDLHCVISVVLL